MNDSDRCSEQEFNLYSYDTQIKLLRHSGTYLLGRTTTSYRILLYELNGFYVEMWYTMAAGEICRIEIMDNNETLDLYLANIELEFLT